MNKLHLEIITPEGVIFTDDVSEVVVPGSEGELGILSGHIALFAKLKPGEIMVKKGMETYFLAVTGGFLEVLNDNVNILADYAVRAESIEIAKVEEAKKRAEKLLEEKKDVIDATIAQAELQRTILELKVARRRKMREQPASPSTS